MSSSRSVAAARARRANPEPPQQNYSKGPITSINSQSSFSTTTGSASRVSGGGSKQQQQQQQQQQQDPALSSKLSVTNIISLMSLRLGRLEAFVHQYNLDKSNGSDNNVGNVSNVTNIRTDDAVIRNIMMRLEGLEKSKQTRRDDQETEPMSIKANETITKINEDVDSLYDEVEDIKDLLLKLQSFTMETNQKLVSVMFQDTNQMQIENLDEPDYASIEHDEPTQSISGNLKDMINQELAESSLSLSPSS